MIQIYHNPRCTKSRECLAFMEDSGKKYEIIKYLENPATANELKTILSKLNCKPINLVRQKEKLWIENYKNQELTDDQIIEILVTNPILIERPIVINGEKAAIARPLESAKAIL